MPDSKKVCHKIKETSLPLNPLLTGVHTNQCHAHGRHRIELSIQKILSTTVQLGKLHHHGICKAIIQKGLAYVKKT